MRGEIVRPLMTWYAGEKRPLPWRSDPTPYRVWVSEIMLQQTRIEAAMPYFERFIKAAPDAAALAALPDERLMKLWEGLGYYSRARNLKKAAEILVSRFGGELPADYEQLLALPGIGEYTAGAIASIAFHLPTPAVDGNVMRVAMRLENRADDVMLPATKRAVKERLAAIMPSDEPGDFNAALMELGERICLPHAAPLCAVCPIRGCCEGYRAGTAADLPVRVVKTRRRVEKRWVAVAICDGRVLLHKRPATGLLASLWELPNAEGDDPAAVIGTLPLTGATVSTALPAARHLFSHIEWQMQGVALRFPAQPIPADYALVTPAGLVKRYALPSAFKAYAELIPILLSKKETEKGDAKR